MKDTSLVKITLIDTINCHVGGLTKGQIAHIQDKTGIVDKQIYHSTAYKLGHIDTAKHFFMDDEGFTFIYMLEDIIDIIENDFGVSGDDIELIDESEPSPIPDNLSIDENFLLEETGFLLREHQLEAINRGLSVQCGLFDASTNAGKTLVTVGIAKALDPYIKTVTIVPSEQLLNQTYHDFCKTSLSVGKLNAKIKPKDREEFINNHQHIIITNKLFMNEIEYFKKHKCAIMLDEVHAICGDVLLDILRFDIGHFPFRLGMTGSVPKDKLKRTKIFNHLGNDIIMKVEPHELEKKGYSSKANIYMYTTKDAEVEELFSDMQERNAYSWEVEQEYNLKNLRRVDAIKAFLNKLPTKNTLVLCHAEFGNRLAKSMDKDFIDKDTSVTDRQEAFSKFTDDDNHMQLASYGTSSTGISQNLIHRVVAIDFGKNETYILQGIGRGTRKSHMQDYVEIIDIDNNMKYGKKHRTERKSLYKRKKFKFVETNEYIEVL